MCDGISTGAMFAMSMAMSAASATASYMQQNAIAESNNSYQSEQAKAYNEAAEQNAKIANSEYIEQAAAENIKQMQREAAASEEIQEIKREATEKAGTALASSEAAGANLAMLLEDFDRQEARYKDTVRQQLDMDSVQSDIAIKGFRDTAVNRGKANQRYVPKAHQGGSLFGALTTFGGGTLSAYDRYSRDKEGKLYN